jgi:hypothetical protein
MVLPMVGSSFDLTVNQQTFIPIMAGEGLCVSCTGFLPDGTVPSQSSVVTAGGYFVPAPP